MPEVIMSYELYEGDMIALKRREPLVRCRDCAKYVESGIQGVLMCDVTLRVKGKNAFCDEAERKSK